MKKQIIILPVLFSLFAFFITGCSKYKGDTGELNFWTDTNAGGQIKVIVFVSTSANGQTAYIDMYYPSGPPACSSGATAKFTLQAGVYGYQATAPGYLKTGTVTVKRHECQMIKL